MGAQLLHKQSSGHDELMGYKGKKEGSWLLHHLPLPMQQEVENFKKVNMISREQFDTLTPEPPVDPNQEVPPGPPRFQQGKRQGT